MPMWSIGPIRGQFQPESFTETQSCLLEDIEIFNKTSRILFKGWSPREVTISFVVDGMCDPVEGDQTWSRDRNTRRTIDAAAGSEPRAADPEEVWREIQRLQRDPEGRQARRVPVVIPGWGGNRGGNTPRFAVISEASINRTHIRGNPSVAVRAVITVTLRELANDFFIGVRSAERIQNPPEED